MTMFDMQTFQKAIVRATTVYRKGEPIERKTVGPIEVIEVFDYPSVDEASTAETLVDLLFVKIGVNDVVFEDKEVWLRMLTEWGWPTLKEGPSYIHAGAELGDQELALRLFAICEVLSLVKLMTPKNLGCTDEGEIMKLAGNGLLFAIPTKRLTDAIG